MHSRAARLLLQTGRLTASQSKPSATVLLTDAQQRTASSSSASTSQSAQLESTRVTSTKYLPAAAGLLGAAGFVAFSQQQQSRQSLECSPGSGSGDSHWSQQLTQRPGVLEVITAQDMLSEAHPILKRDHLFSSLLSHGQVKDLRCFYDMSERKLHAVVQLGEGTCGYPGITHGGMTASILDETLGFLLLALKKQNALPFWGPAFTAHLEVEYKARIPARKTLLCTAEVESIEGRKVWMKASITDATGKVLATARALFVAPKPHKFIKDGLKLLWSGGMGAARAA